MLYSVVYIAINVFNAGFLLTLAWCELLCKASLTFLRHYFLLKSPQLSETRKDSQGIGSNSHHPRNRTTQTVHPNDLWTSSAPSIWLTELVATKDIHTNGTYSVRSMPPGPLRQLAIFRCSPDSLKESAASTSTTTPIRPVEVKYKC